MKELHQYARKSRSTIQKQESAAVLLELAYSGFLILPIETTSLTYIAPKDSHLTKPDFLVDIEQFIRRNYKSAHLPDECMMILLATDCRVPRDFDINCFCTLHTAILRSIARNVEPSPGQPAYVLLNAIQNTHPTFLTRDDRHLYLLWRFSDKWKEISYPEFCGDPSQRKNMWVHGIKRERIELPKHVEQRKALEKRNSSIRNARQKDGGEYVENLLNIAFENGPNSPSEYFAALRHQGGANQVFRPQFWLESPVNYPGREKIDITKMGELWFIAAQEFLKNWHGEKLKEPRRQLHIFLDYILLYLPWWFEKNPNASISFPNSPAKFSRFVFVTRTRFNQTTDVEELILPKTVYELLPLRLTSTGGENTFRRIISKFFDFVIAHFEDEDLYTVPEMKNPIRQELDNESQKASTKTNKVVFTREIYPYLIHFLQSVETFGEYLQQIALHNGAFQTYKNPPPEGYDTSSWGYVPVFWYANKLYKVSHVPSVFQLALLTLYVNPPEPAGIYVNGWRANQSAPEGATTTLTFPVLSTLRIILTGVEMGLRNASVRWLDRRTFDRLTRAVTSLNLLHEIEYRHTWYMLHINTDKSHDAWDSLASVRAYRSLLAEKYVQLSLKSDRLNSVVYYEGRSKSRFGEILPLFRSTDSEQPVRYDFCRYMWTAILHSFEAFIGKIPEFKDDYEAGIIQFVKRRDASLYKNGQVHNEYDAINTLHASRATFLTLRDGSFELEELGNLVGHSNKVATQHYQVPFQHETIEKLKRYDRRLYIGTEVDEALTEHSFVDTQAKNSRVRRAFENSREQAISDFRFIAGTSPIWSLDDSENNLDALKQLRKSSIGVIRWHPTHACPVGNECPKEVIEKIGEKFRCGCCPLAAKCVDHLPAILAKQLELSERIRLTTSRITFIQSEKQPDEEVARLQAQRKLDAQELTGWKIAADILSRELEQWKNDENIRFHADKPEMVTRALNLVSRNSNETQFLLERLVTANAYPSMQSDELRSKASKFTKIILANQGRLKEAALLEIEPYREVATCVGFLTTYMRASRKTLSEISTELQVLSEQTRKLTPPSAADIVFSPPIAKKD